MPGRNVSFLSHPIFLLPKVGCVFASAYEWNENETRRTLLVAISRNLSSAEQVVSVLLLSIMDTFISMFNQPPAEKKRRKKVKKVNCYAFQ